MDIKEISLTERQRHWFEHLQACDASGKGIAGYAAAHGLDAKAMYAGKKVLVKKGVLPRTRPSCFQRAAVKDPMHGSAWRILLPNGLSVTFSGAVDARALGTVLAAATAVD